MRIKNTKETSDVWCGQTIESLAEYDILASELSQWQANDKVITDLTSGDILIGDGTAYKSGAADAISFLLGADTTPKDPSGRIITRSAITSEGNHAQFHSLRISTSTTNGLYSKDKDGNDTELCTYTMKDSEGEITADENECVKTIVTWEANFNMDLVGGTLLQAAPPTTDVYLYVTAAPDIPAIYGGSIAFTMGGINLKDVGLGGVCDFDGRATKYIAYDPTYHSGKFEIVINHNAGVKHSFTVIFELFKSP